MDTEGAVQAPFRVYDPTLFSRPSPSAGGLLRSGKFAWAFFPSGLLSVYSSGGECVSQVKLVPFQRKGRRLEVSCSCELSLSSFPTRCRSLPLALAVSVEGVRAKTTLVLVDALSSSLLRAIEVPWTVSSLCGVSEEAVRAVTSGLFSSSILREFSGVLAAGCAGGHVILVDLALGVIPVGAGSLAKPLQLVFVDSSQMGGGAVVSSTRSDGTSLACIDVLASHHEKGQFHYHSSSHSSTPRTYPTDSLAITALHFVPQTASLLIGYSMGSFQIFDVGKMAIVHGSPPPKVPVPVTHFGFQEPENDPKNNVYFWVARGNPPHADLKVESKLTLYQVLFANKIPSALGTTYQDFMRCGPGFIYPLTPTPTRPHPNRSHSSTLLLCHTPHLPRGSRELDESYDMAGGPDLTVSVFVWGCGDSAHKDYIVGVFDLNQYYHSQVPKMLQWRSLRKRSGLLGCSYFAFYSLKPMTNDSTIMDVAIVDVVQFLSSLPPIPETHLWPTSLSFNVTALTTEGFLRCSCLGLQRKALQELTYGDVATFSCPQTIFSLCEAADLLEPAWDLDHANREDQQKALLSVALDHDMKSLLLECAFTWFRGGGDTCFSVFVEWLRGTIKDLKIEKEHLCHLIFSGAADSAEKSSLLLEKLLMKYSHLSSLLTSLLSSLSPPHTLTQLSPHTLSAQFSEEPHVQELSGFYVNTATSQTVVQVVVWCLDNGVLPVATGGGEPILCSGSVLEQFYGLVRRKKDMCKLCVDYLCEEVQIDGYHYPPDSLEDHLVIFTSTVSLAPHCLMIYFLMDLCTLRESDYDTTELLEEYCQEHHLPTPILMLTRALWELDHSHFQAAVELMRGGALGSREMFPWQQLAIASHLSRSPATIISLTTLLAESDNVVQEPRLLLKVLVERRNIWDALNIIRSCDDDTIDELFQYFLDLCQEYKCLSELVKLPLTDTEDAVFCLYLEECPLFKAQELLVLHYAAHYRYGDAIKHQARIRPQAMLDPVPGARERSLSRDSLLEPFKNTAPSVLRDLWNSATMEPPSPPTHDPRTRVRNPPLSSVLAKNEAANVASSVETIYQEMQKIRDAAEAEPVSSPFTVKDSICPSTPFFSHPPSVRKAILSRKKAAGVSAVQATPLAQDRPSRVSTPFQPPQTPGTASGLSSFRTHMERFRERMFQLSQTATNIDPSFIRTPPVRSQPLQGERLAVPTTGQAPPSILKVRSEKKLADEREGEGEVGEKGEGVTTETRRIRFAEDRMVFESSKASLTSTQPLRSEPVGPTAEAMAVATPLPSSDDSDLFYSFTDSPSPPPKPIRVSPSSQGTPSHPPRGTPSQSPLPKTKLFIGADDDYEESKQQQQQQSSAISTSELESTAVAKTTVTTTTGSPLKVRFPVLSRLGIGLHSSPLESGRSRAGGGFTPRHPSPLEHSFISRDFRGNLGRGTPRQSPLSISREKEKKEKGSSIDFTGPSVTMVPVLTRDKEIGSGWGSSAETTPTDPTRAGGGSGEEQTYSFSPGKVISAAPPVSEMSELKRTPLSRATGPVYAFSPPFTRSAARRAAAAAAMGTGDTGEGVREGGGRKETRGKRSTSREQSLATGHVDLVTPPSQHSTPATGAREGQRAKRKVALHSMATRSSRSTRLVQDKK